MAFSLTFSRLTLALMTSAALVACGGGGGSEPAPEPTDPVPVSARFGTNYSDYMKAGDTATFSASGACTGAAVLTISPALTSELFEGVLRLFNVTRLVGTLQAPPTATPLPVPTGPCQLDGVDFTRKNYYGAGDAPIGFAYNGGEYLVANWSGPLPTQVERGQSGRLAALDRYRDSTKQVAVGTASIDYEVGGPAGGPPTVDIVTRFFSPVGLKQFTETLRYAYVDGAGLRLVSMTYEYLGGATLQLTRQ